MKVKVLKREEVKTRTWCARTRKWVNPMDLGAKVFKLQGPWWTLFTEPRKSWHSKKRKENA